MRCPDDACPNLCNVTLKLVASQGGFPRRDPALRCKANWQLTSAGQSLKPVQQLFQTSVVHHGMPGAGQNGANGRQKLGTFCIHGGASGGRGGLFLQKQAKPQKFRIKFETQVPTASYVHTPFLAETRVCHDHRNASPSFSRRELHRPTPMQAALLGKGQEESIPVPIRGSYGAPPPLPQDFRKEAGGEPPATARRPRVQSRAGSACKETDRCKKADLANSCLANYRVSSSLRRRGRVPGPGMRRRAREAGFSLTAPGLRFPPAF